MSNGAESSDRRSGRVLLAKPGLDGHDRGAKVVARGLRDAGFDVIYTGLRQTPQSIAVTALQEDVDVICLSILSGAHVSICSSLAEQMRLQGISDIPVVVGGIIPDDDADQLSELGVRAVFGPGSNLNHIAEVVTGLVRTDA